MNCKSCRVEIEELDGGGPLAPSARAHMESCATCLAFHNESESLRQMIGRLEVVSAPADFDFRLRARIAALKSGSHGRFAWKSFSPGAWSLASVMVFVMLVAIGLIIRQAGKGPSLNSDSQPVANNNSAEQQIAPPYSPAAPVVKNVPQGTAPSNALDVPTANTAGTRNPKVNSQDIKPRGSIRIPDEVDGIRSTDSGLRSTAKTVMPPGIPDPTTLSNASVAFPVRGSMRPVTIQLNDPRAKSQSISLRRVTFGGQDVLEPGSVKPAPFSTLQGVW